MLQLGATGIEEGEEEEDSWFAVLLGSTCLHSVAWRGKQLSSMRRIFSYHFSRGSYIRPLISFLFA
jgi:hypothetical protein